LEREVKSIPVKGAIIRVAGSVIEATGMSEAEMHEVVDVGKDRLVGEIIRLVGDIATVQVYESTSGLKTGEEVIGTGSPLSAELGPGLIGNIYSGTQKPLEWMREKTGAFIKRGVRTIPLPRDKEWLFNPEVKVGRKLVGGDILGTVKESELIEHRILVPPSVQGELVKIVEKDEYKIDDAIATVEVDKERIELKMFQRWPVRKPRPYKRRLLPSVPLVTGQRVIDTFVPIAKGGSAAIPGGFGTGKTIMQHQLAKWSNADIIIYVGCGERGNEMVDVLSSFPKLSDPRTGRPLMERTILIANTSNMPVSAREASIYTGITIAEYYRDMGYDVALMADSTSRWAEALREVSGRLEEMPAEEGFPSYLPTRLAEFYERTGVVETLGSEKRIGSICAIGAVSPPGGDFSEPVTQHTKRFTRVFWALDKELADARHYPSINWLQSYSGYLGDLSEWWSKNIDKEWNNYREAAMNILQREDELKDIVKLVGSEALPDRQRLILETARILRTAFLQQNALDPVDTYCHPIKQFKMLKIIIDFHKLAERIISKGAPIFKITKLSVLPEIIRMKNSIPNEKSQLLDKLYEKVQYQLSELEKGLV
jgi:V/A-type H+-transporting ATPase subunit A